MGEGWGRRFRPPPPSFLLNNILSVEVQGEILLTHHGGNTNIGALVC